jgi:hypothetical protein
MATLTSTSVVPTKSSKDDIYDKKCKNGRQLWLVLTTDDEESGHANKIEILSALSKGAVGEAVEIVARCLRMTLKWTHIYHCGCDACFVISSITLPTDPWIGPHYCPPYTLKCAYIRKGESKLHNEPKDYRYPFGLTSEQLDTAFSSLPQSISYYYSPMNHYLNRNVHERWHHYSGGIQTAPDDVHQRERAYEIDVYLRSSVIAIVNHELKTMVTGKMDITTITDVITSVVDPLPIMKIGASHVDMLPSKQTVNDDLNNNE